MKPQDKYLINEEYRISEAMSASKALSKLRDKLISANTAIEVRLVGGMFVQFLKKFGKSVIWTTEVSNEMNDLLTAAKLRVGGR